MVLTSRNRLKTPGKVTRSLWNESTLKSHSITVVVVVARVSRLSPPVPRNLRLPVMVFETKVYYIHVQCTIFLLHVNRYLKNNLYAYKGKTFETMEYVLKWIERVYNMQYTIYYIVRTILYCSELFQS